MKEPVTITWLGHASIEITFDGRSILFDPWIEGNPKCTKSISDLKNVEAACVTHGHDDHLGDSIEIVKKTGAKLICSPEIAIYADKRGVGYDTGSYPLNIGGSWDTGDYRITMVNALHTSDILGDEFKKDGTVMPGSGCSGYILKFADGPCIYFAGDTGVFLDMGLIRDLYSPDFAICPVGGKYNMGYREAAYSASLIGARYFLPIHHGTFDNQMLDFSDLEKEMQVRAPQVRLLKLKPSESFTLPAAN